MENIKEPGIIISEIELIFKEFPSEKIGKALYCKSFKIPLKDIKYIAISPRMALDDEMLFILIIDVNLKIYKVPYAYYLCQFDAFDSFFLKRPIHKEWAKFKHKDHYGKVDKIIYPEEFYGQNDGLRK